MISKSIIVMKANEVPEKVYLHLTTGSRLLNGRYYKYKPAKIHFDDKIIEYTRTDAFIEKACEYLESVFKDLTGYCCGSGMVDDFRKAMEGE